MNWRITYDLNQYFSLQPWPCFNIFHIVTFDFCLKLNPDQNFVSHFEQKKTEVLRKIFATGRGLFTCHCFTAHFYNLFPTNGFFRLYTTFWIHS